jgi:hypothetical protein
MNEMKAVRPILNQRYNNMQATRVRFLFLRQPNHLSPEMGNIGAGIDVVIETNPCEPDRQ